MRAYFGRPVGVLLMLILLVVAACDDGCGDEDGYSPPESEAR
jgi:hypothetical protein